MSFSEVRRSSTVGNVSACFIGGKSRKMRKKYLYLLPPENVTKVLKQRKKRVQYIATDDTDSEG